MHTTKPFFFAALLSSSLVLIAACSSDENANPNPTRVQQQASGLTKAYASNCARCHGDRGEGQTLSGTVYPVIPGGKDESAFIEIVRSGRGDMPMFDATVITDADLKADYAWMTTERK